MSTDAGVSMPSSAPNFLSAERHRLKNIPHPPETWRFQDVDITRKHLLKLIQDNLVDVVGEDPKTNVNIYRLHEEPAEYVQSLIESEHGLPCCGSAGFINRGEGYECKICGTTHDEHTVRESLWGGRD